MRWEISGRLAVAARAESAAVANLVYVEPSREVSVAPVARIFLDANVGPTYVFAQWRADRGFDAKDRRMQAGLEEWMVRAPFAEGGRGYVQGGRFATVFGSWARRHAAWDYPFVSAPLAQEQVVGLWDSKGLPAAAKLEEWSHVKPLGAAEVVAADEINRIPIMWGPVYATGAAMGWNGHAWELAVEAKEAGLSSRPQFWGHETQAIWREPAIAARAAWRPSATWQTGISWAQGVYLRPQPESVVAGARREDYRQETLGMDVTFAWRAWQVWGELMRAEFTLPTLGEARVWSGTIEGKWRASPRWAWAARVGAQEYARVRLPDGSGVRWGRDTLRVEAGPVVRLGAHAQMKLQFSATHETPAQRAWSPGAAMEWACRF